MKWGYSIVNVYGKQPVKKEVYNYNIASSDEWAKKRLAELARSGVNAKTIRGSKREPLCVCYRTDKEVDVK